MAIGFAVVGVRENAVIYRATATAAADTGTISNATLKADYKKTSSELGKILHVTNTVANILKNALTVTRGRVTVTPENAVATWAVEVTEGAGPNFTPQLDVIGGAANGNTALIIIEAIPTQAR
jgi:hypothetical protein